jgi:hypothetical protein
MAPCPNPGVLPGRVPTLHTGAPANDSPATLDHGGQGVIRSPDAQFRKLRQVSLCYANFLFRRRVGGSGLDNCDAGTPATRAGMAESAASYAIGYSAAPSYLGGRGL